MADTLPESFSIATFFGVWVPIPWRSNFIESIYKIYTYFNVLIIFQLTLGQFIAMVIFSKTLTDFAEASFVFLAGFNGFIKGMNILLKLNGITKLVKTLNGYDCLPRNPQEKAITDKWNKLARYTVLSYASYVGLSAGHIATWPLFSPTEKYSLQLPVWYPYNVNSDLVYWSTFLHIGWGVLIGAGWNVACDTFVAGFLMQTCAQLDIVTHRLKYLPEESKGILISEKSIIKSNVQHHIKIFSIARKVQSIFAPAILLQLCLSVFIFCVTIVGLTAEKAISTPISTLLIFLSSILWELFLYCWFGNESMGFIEGITNSNWTQLHISTLKQLLIIMKRTKFPILVTCGPFITLSLKSYTGIIKLSYSVFNVLKTTP